MPASDTKRTNQKAWSVGDGPRQIKNHSGGTCDPSSIRGGRRRSPLHQQISNIIIEGRPDDP